MGTSDAIVLDGFMEEETVTSDLHGSTARFRLTVFPTDERTAEMVLPCGVTDPGLALAVIHDLVPGDKPRVTGHLRPPAYRTSLCGWPSPPSPAQTALLHIPAVWAGTRGVTGRLGGDEFDALPASRDRSRRGFRS
ncbi:MULTISPECIES: hypothetical protein [Streptomyces]|uniref:hypothetical protein n=1 Tax=Streptomyces TaxID=1883 RepID=UPI001BB5C6DB|nr:hypothetical protein [Streptomyces sp. CA-256286]QTA36876.1 hypothetical protein JHY03_70920 [Streptomyces sp. CA-256286]